MANQSGRWPFSAIATPSHTPVMGGQVPTADEGPQHLISTSAVKVQRLLALLHIMKEGWSLDPAGNPRKDWVTERGIPELFLFYFILFFLSSQMPLFSLFCFGVCGRRFFAETNFLLLFFRHDGEKNLYRLIMLKACILTQDIDEHTYTQITNQTHTFKDATLKKKKKNGKKNTLYMYKYVQMPTQVLKQTHACACTHRHTHIHKHTHQPAAILVFVPTQVLCSVTGQALDQRRKQEEEERRGESRIIYMHHSLGNRDQRTKRFLKEYKYINI